MKKWQGIMVAMVVAALTVFGNFSAWAGPHNSYVDQRLMSQEQWIQQAWQAGQVSPREYQRLEHQQQYIRTVESQMREHGRLNPAQKTQLDQMLNESEWDIGRATHRHWR